MNAKAARCIAIVLAALTAAPGVAIAQSGGGGASDADKEDAYKKHMSNGVKLFQDKDYDAAIAEFRAAYDAKPKASPLLNIALCYKARFNYPKAIEALEAAIAKHGDTLDPKDKRAAQDAIADMRKLLAYVKLDVTPDTAIVSIDGEDLPKGGPNPVPLGPGQHKIAARADGFAPGEQSVTVASGEQGKTLTLKLSPNAGFLSANAADANTWIAIDQKPMSQGKFTGFLPPGRHSVQFYKSGGAAYTTDVTITVGRITEVRAGAGGIPVASGGAAVMGPGMFVPPDFAEKPKPEPPPKKGWYGVATATVYANTEGVSLPPYSTAGLSSSTYITDTGSQTGGAGGVRFGRRFNNLIALELMFDYGSIAKSFTLHRTTGGDAKYDYVIANALFGGNLRLMSKGEKARFVADLGGGLAYNHLGFDAPKCGLCTNLSGADGFVNTEVGFELDFGGVLLGVAFQQIFTSTNAIQDSQHVSAGDDIQARVGAGLHIGYATW